MKRREFLEKTAGLCTALWLGPNLIETGRVKANPQAAKLIHIRTGLEKQTKLNQEYFWFEVLLSNQCEIVKTQTGNELSFFIKNCQLGDVEKEMKYTNPYVRQSEIRTVEGQDLLLRLIRTNTVAEVRYALIPSVLFSGKFRLRIEIGTFAHSKAITEKDLAIQENNLVFGPLETRAETTFIVIHHTALSETESSAEAVHQLHIRRGWSGIGYHYVIRKDGTIERGRPRDTVGAHTYQHNWQSIGIVLTGNFDEDEPTSIQLEKAALLVAALCNLYSIRPDEKHVFGHRNFNSTSCPGEHLYRKLPQVRSKAMEYVKA